MSLALRRLAFLPAAINSRLSHHRPTNPPTLSPTLLPQGRGGSYGGGGIRVLDGADHYHRPLVSRFGFNSSLRELTPLGPKHSTQDRPWLALKLISLQANLARTSSAAEAAAAEGSDHGEGDGGAATAEVARVPTGDRLFSIAAQCLFWSVLFVAVGKIEMPTASPSIVAGNLVEFIVLIFLNIFVILVIEAVGMFMKGCLYVAVVPPLAWSSWRLCRCLWRRWVSRRSSWWL